ncbi:pirin family protein [Citrobacter sp. JGM124]|uniref:pirin family protein n=1 Tax=Citrobacter sp. JGM124 TaxID=2799789 RepID=UPI001BA7779F|nr:pirin family protein [Citrobacter sp. JGM124]MBS0849131.1 pirin family protein [Citrobacter sp. JGM124]
MITIRTAKQCGEADYGWLKARYTFSFGHYFDPKLLGYASLRVLNQEVLAPGASLQPRSYPKVDILNLVLEGEAEYRDNDGRHILVKTGEAVLLSAQPRSSYSEHNVSKKTPLTRIQLWLDACPEGDNPLIQKISLNRQPQQLIASVEGGKSTLQLRQNIRVHHLNLQPGQQQTISLLGRRAYLQSINGTVTATSDKHTENLTCGDGAFICDEGSITLLASTGLKALLIDLAA